MSETETALGHAELAARHLARAEHAAAFDSLAAALALAPHMDALWAQFSDLIRYFNLRHPIPPVVRELLAQALEHPAVDPGDLVRPVSTLALSRPAGDVFDEPLLLRLLEDTVIRDASLERLIAQRRREMLDRVLVQAPSTEMAVAIAHQCFNTEYVFDETEDETREVARLGEAIAAGGSVPPHWYAVYAAYRSLGSLGATPGAPASLVRCQIDQPLEENRLRSTIPSMGETADRVSAAVRDHYEANPYPRWVRVPAAGFATVAVPDGARILIAGCGTGQHAIGAALRFPGAKILAIDLSLASLAYAKRKTAKLGLRNIEYRHADLLGLGGFAERFDLIESSGVLHHLAEPLAGWRVLKSLLKPGGRMRVGLYSEAGRRGVVRARKLIASAGWRPDAQGIRACRAAIRARAEDELLAKVARSEDFFSMSGCRDLLFHMHEARFSLPQIERMLQALQLRFLGFEFSDSGATLRRYRERFSGDAAAANLRNWHRFEQEFPDSFSRMYQFWVA